MYTDPDPHFLAPARSTEMSQECPGFFSKCRSGNPTVRLWRSHALQHWVGFARRVTVIRSDCWTTTEVCALLSALLVHGLSLYTVQAVKVINT